MPTTKLGATPLLVVLPIRTPITVNRQVPVETRTSVRSSARVEAILAVVAIAICEVDPVVVGVRAFAAVPVY